MTADETFAEVGEACVDLVGLALFAPLADMLCKTDIARQWLYKQLASVADGGMNLPRGYSDAVLQSLVMFDDGRAQLSVAIVSADGWRRQRDDRLEEQDVVGFADGWTRIHFLSAPAVAIQRFTLEDNIAHGHPPVAVRTGDVIDLANAHETLRFSDLGSDVVMLRLLVRDPDVAFAVECDAATGRVLRTRQAQSHEGRTQMIVSLLRSLGKVEAVAIIAEKIDTWSPHLRWHGVREALALDSISGTALLSRMAAHDADAGLRSLAERTRADLMARHPMLAELA